MTEIIQNITQWLMLVVPALMTVLGICVLVRHWLHGSAWKFFGAFCTGIIGIAAGFSLITIIAARLIGAQVQTCQTGATPWDCYQIEILIAYPVLIGLISFGLFLVGVPIWRIGRAVLRRQRNMVS